MMLCQHLHEISAVGLQLKQKSAGTKNNFTSCSHYQLGLVEISEGSVIILSSFGSHKMKHMILNIFGEAAELAI